MLIGFHRLLAVTLLAVLACGAGVHLAALQAAAWGTMLWNYTATEISVAEAARKTFDGEHPCKLCTRIKDASHGSKTNPVKSVVAAKRIDLIALPVAENIGPRLRGAFSYPHPGDVFASSRKDAPPVPVPIVG